MGLSGRGKLHSSELCRTNRLRSGDQNLTATDISRRVLTTLILATFILGIIAMGSIHGILSVNASSATTAPSSVSKLLTFQGLNQTQSQYGAPPDVQIAAGPSSVMEMVNIERAVYSKSGSLQLIQSLRDFFNTGGKQITDPKVVYDPSTTRWFATLLELPNNTTGNFVLLAVSVTNDPTGTWKLYNMMSTASTIQPDQPILGMSDDKVVVSVNLYANKTSRGAEWWVLNKNDLVSMVASPRFTTFLGPTLGSVHPVKSLSSTSTEYMVSTGFYDTDATPPGGTQSTSNVTLFQVNGVPGGTNVTTTQVSLHLSSPIVSPMPIGTIGVIGINPQDQRIEDAAFFQGRIWLAVNQNSTYATIQTDDVRLIQIDVSSPNVTIRQDFEYPGTSTPTYFPALQIDGTGNLDLVYGVGPPTKPGLAITGQAVNDPIGSVTASITVNAGLSSSNAEDSRYGDYFGASIDPVNPNLVWVAGETFLASSKCFAHCWTTWISEMHVNPIQSFTNLTTFTSVSVNTTCYLRVYSSSLGGACSILATNSTNSQVLFSRNYIVPNIGINVTRFLLNVPVSPYRLSSNVQATLSDPVTGTVTITRNVDIDGNGIVNTADRDILTAHFGCRSGDSCYYAPADLNADGSIDISDLVFWSNWNGSTDYT